jgi:hypothetical protein
MKLGQKENKMSPEERCRQEIAGIEDQLRDGHNDIQGLCMALMDWHQEVRLLQREQRESAREDA